MTATVTATPHVNGTAPTSTTSDAAKLLDRCHLNGSYAYFWTIDKNGKKQAHAYAIGKVRKLPAVDGDIYISVHPLNRSIGANERAHIPDVQAINCFFAEFDGKDEVLESEYFHYLPDNFATLTKKNDISRAIKDAQEIVFYANPTPYLDRAKKRITAAPVAPSIVVFSGGGFHCYWFLAETVLIDDNNRESIKEMQRNWVRVVEGDKAAADLVRVLRVPGTVNCKPGLKRPMVKIVAESTAAPLSLAEFAGIIELHPPTEQQADSGACTSREPCNDDVIASFNQSNSVGDILLRNGYTKGSTLADGSVRYSRPGRDATQTSIVIFPNGRSFHHSGNDALYTEGHSRDAFDAYTNLEHNGDAKAAYEAAKRTQGKWTDSSSFQPPATSGTSIQATKPKENVKLWSVSELIDAEFPDPVYLVPGLLPTGLCVLAGRPKLGKSWLALQLATAIGSNGNFLGLQTERGNVLYYALEDNPRRIQERLKKQNTAKLRNVSFVFEFGQSLANAIGDLTTHIRSGGFRLIVIDTISRAIGKADQMDQGQMNVIFGMLQQLAIKHDVTILLIDHHKKGNGFSRDVIDDVMGATSKMSVADAAWGLYRDRSGKDAVLKTTGRDIEDKEISITFDKESFLWQSHGNANDVKTGTLKGDIADAITEMGGTATTKDIADFVRRPPSNVSRDIRAMLDTNQVARFEGVDKYGKKSVSYMLTKNLSESIK